MDAYAEALRRAIRPGCVVLDIGTGTGICALLACQFGAGRVYALEPDPAIEVARATAAVNGCSDRITFIRDFSWRVNLPERADVIVSDLRGALPPHGLHVPAIADARRRHLAPGGTLIPGQDFLCAALVEAEELHATYLTPWGDNDYGLNLGPSRARLANLWHRACVTSEQLLTGPRRWAEFDYSSLESPNVAGSLSWVVGRPGTGHGIVCWFDTVLVPGVGFSSAPDKPEVVYHHGVFPWPAPVRLSAGDVVSAELRADLVGQDYVWRWSTQVHDATGRRTADFRQSSFAGEPLEASLLRKCAADFVPVRGEEAEIDRVVLELMDGATPLREIARRLAERFPARFPRWADALTRAGILSEKYGR